MNYRNAAFLIGLMLLAPGDLRAQEHHHAGSAAVGGVGSASRSECSESSLKCATSATPAFGPDGRLWLAWSAGGRISVAYSNDQGFSFSSPVLVNREIERIDEGADSRPQIVVAPNGDITVLYDLFRGRFVGQVLASHSMDGGSTFSSPQPVNENPASQRFQSLSLDASGTLFAFWIDRREEIAAKQEAKDYAGGALAYAISRDGGASFSPARIIQSNTCECCRLGISFEGTGRPVVGFRNVYDGIVRDHAVMAFADPETPGPVHRVSVDDWRIDACPHHGPSLAVSASGAYHIAWFTDGNARKGVFYARSDNRGRTFSNPMAIGSKDHQISRPYVLSAAGRIWLAWKEFDGERTSVMITTSRDDGKKWSGAREVAKTEDASDHPLLISDGQRIYLSWYAHNEGYRLIALEDGVQ